MDEQKDQIVSVVRWNRGHSSSIEASYIWGSGFMTKVQPQVFDALSEIGEQFNSPRILGRCSVPWLY
jgi:hypothetical protein